MKTPASASSSPSKSPSTKSRVLIVDDHELLREGLRLLIDREPDLEVCGDAADEPAGIRKVSQLSPEIVIVDLSLSSGSGLELIKWIHKNSPDTKIIVSSMHDESLYGERVLRAGANGYVNKQDPARTILRAIREVRNGKLYFSDELTQRMVSQFRVDRASPAESPIHLLSDRELEVFRLIGQGLTTGQIATQLHRSPSTVSTYRDRIKTKLGLTNGAELTYRAIHWTDQSD